jgi:hypothetical protein
MRADQVRTLPPEFHRIRLELAREEGRPEGDRSVGYTIVAPLRSDGRLDAALARTHRDACAVIRFRPDAEPEEGHLRRRPGGSWSFHYDFPDDAEDDDAAYRLDQHRFVPGEYVTIAEDEGLHTYRVISVAPL